MNHISPILSLAFTVNSTRREKNKLRLKLCQAQVGVKVVVGVEVGVEFGVEVGVEDGVGG